MFTMENVWFKNAVFYSLDVETFYDSNGDGIGDFQGLTEKLEYIAGLGVTCIWLLPFYPSPNRDNGYDVMDYYNVDERLGTLGDFAQFLIKAEQIGLRVIIDLVVNHTSIRHPWFQKAIADKNSPYRDYYVWSDKPLEYDKNELMFKGEENTIWHYNEKAEQYYLHRFYKEQPDLNISNPKVREEIIKIIGFWLRLGVNGFRIDAAEMLVEAYGLPGVEENNLISFINEIREYVQWQRKDAFLLAEVNAGPDEMMKYLQEEERMHMLFNFYVNQYMFLALAEEQKISLTQALESLPTLTKTSQWLNFLRHHDELNLRLLSKKDQQKVFDVFAPDENMRMFGFGIRRRLAPMMNGSLERLKMVYSLLFSMPGVPMIRFGDEIGMGDNLELEGRGSVTTPMQWTPSPNGGFSSAEESRLVHPIISGGEFGFENVNVLSAQQNSGSLLNWLKRLISIRRQCPEIGSGELFIVPYKNFKVLIHGFELKGKKIFILHNLSGNQLQVKKNDFFPGSKNLFDVFSDESENTENDHIQVKAYGYRWFRTD